MEFVPMKLTDLGRNAEDGVTLVDQINDAIAKVSAAVLNPLLEEAGEVVCKIKITKPKKSTDGVTVAIVGQVHPKLPSRRAAVTFGYVDQKGRVLIQGEQIAMPFVARTKAAVEEQLVEAVDRLIEARKSKEELEARLRVVSRAETKPEPAEVAEEEEEPT